MMLLPSSTPANTTALECAPLLPCCWNLPQSRDICISCADAIQLQYVLCCNACTFACARTFWCCHNSLGDQEVPAVISIEMDTKASPLSAHAKACMKHGGVWLLTATTHKSIIVIDDDAAASDQCDNKQAAATAADKTVTVEVPAVMT
jgi:hypothetical protein